MKKNLLLLLCLSGFISYGQTKCNYINFILLVDGKIEGINGNIFVVDSLKSRVLDTLIFKNNIGTLTFSEADYAEFLALRPDQNIVIQFKYSTSIPANPKYEVIYQDTLVAKWLNYGYMIMNVYNFENKKNWKEFEQRKGYGIEWQASERFKIIPRKAKIK